MALRVNEKELQDVYCHLESSIFQHMLWVLTIKYRLYNSHATT